MPNSIASIAALPVARHQKGIDESNSETYGIRTFMAAWLHLDFPHAECSGVVVLKA